MEDNRQILFGGFGKLPLKNAVFNKPKPGDRPLWFEVLESAIFKLTETDDKKHLYGDPFEKPATIEQAWRVYGLFGFMPVCLLSTDQPPVKTDEINHVIKMSSKELVDVLIDLHAIKEDMALQILYHDGHLGHCINLRKYNKDTQRFTYSDPWPDYSLLCKDYNAAGVDAQPENERWSITAAELERVIFAAFVMCPVWSEYMEEKYYTTYDEFASSDFWKFFHLQEVERKEMDKYCNTRIVLKTGGFQSEIDLSIKVNQKNRLVEGQLNVKRSWIIGPQYGLNPFAVDIVRSFITALTPPSDQESASDLIKMFHQIQNPAYTEQMVSAGPEKSKLHRALFTYLGPSPEFEDFFPLFTISMKNVSRDGVDWLQTQITNDVL